LLHGASYPADLGYREEMLALSAANKLKYWGTVSRADKACGWTGDVGRVESFFEPHRVSEIERRLGLTGLGFTPESAAVFVCGLPGTIGAVLSRLIDYGFVPHARAVRDALGVPPDARASLFYELYDSTPIIDVTDPAVIDPLRARMQRALTRRATVAPGASSRRACRAPESTAP
jgi:ferredoxin--NADP+ reductase